MAQKFTTTTCPRNWLNRSVEPSRSSSATGGAGCRALCSACFPVASTEAASGSSRLNRLKKVK